MKHLVILMLFVFGIVFYLPAKTWSPIKDCKVKGEKVKLQMESKSSVTQVSWEKVWQYIPAKDKKRFQEELRAIMLQKGKISEDALNLKLQKLSEKYYQIYLKNLPRKRGIGQKLVNSAKKFFHLVVKFLEDNKRIWLDPAIYYRKMENGEIEYVPQEIHGGRG